MTRSTTFHEMYRDTLLTALNRTGQMPAATRLLGISLRTGFRWKRKYRIVKDEVTGEYEVRKTLKLKK